VAKFRHFTRLSLFMISTATLTENSVTSPTNTLNPRKRLRKCNQGNCADFDSRAQTVIHRLAPIRRAPDRFESPAPHRADRRRRPRRDRWFRQCDYAAFPDEHLTSQPKLRCHARCKCYRKHHKRLGSYSCRRWGRTKLRHKYRSRHNSTSKQRLTNHRRGVQLGKQHNDN